MTFQTIDGVKTWGDPDLLAVAQMKKLLEHDDALDAALMADHHLGYSQPIGGVVAYREHISVSGVGYDIGCGVRAHKTDLVWGDIRDRGKRELLADMIALRIDFGVGSGQGEFADHEIFHSNGLWESLSDAFKGNQRRDGLAFEGPQMLALARKQLGSTGGGNHYVDVLVEGNELDDSPVWIACHFGSRGFGHNIATRFIELATGNKKESDAAVLLHQDSDIGRLYIDSMKLAGDYARLGRELVLNKVGDIFHDLLGKGTILDTVENHHNYAWREDMVNGLDTAWVVRKGATPAFPGQRGFIGGSMGDFAAIIQGVDSEYDHDAFNEQEDALFSTVHGAGRIHSRTWAKGKRRRKNQERKPEHAGNVTRQMMSEATQAFDVVVRGGDVDESPFVYRKITPVLEAHHRSIDIRHWLKPVIVCMAPAGTGADD